MENMPLDTMILHQNRKQAVDKIENLLSELGFASQNESFAICKLDNLYMISTNVDWFQHNSQNK